VVLRVVGGDDLDTLAASLVQQRVQLIIALGTPAAVAAARATSTIPIVMVGVSDPVQNRLVVSLAKPGGNITGVSFLAPELAAKSLQLLAEIQPRPSRVAVLWNANNSGAELVLRRSQEAARGLGLELLPVQVRDRSGVPAALDTIRAAHADGLLVIADEVFAEKRAKVVEFATQQRLPTAFLLREYVERGGLLSYGPSEEQIHDLAAAYVTKILQGARPQDLPIQQPSQFQLVINLKTAKALGLTIPPSVLLRVDQVIE
jgi:putative ABC transport system substrate-binding protein